VQSLIKNDGQRRLLYEMDGAIQRLNQSRADEIARRTLIGCYHNLVREWSET
jgi:PKHD-type hydroxylase